MVFRYHFCIYIDLFFRIFIVIHKVYIHIFICALESGLILLYNTNNQEAIL